MLTPADWHTRYTQQAVWTNDLRQYLYQRSGIRAARRVLDVGCGTGALLPELGAETSQEKNLPDFSPALVCGLDLDAGNLDIAKQKSGDIHLQQADAHHLPFAASSFDLTLCHFLLLWVAAPTIVVGEMARVTRPGGAVLVLAEPDYGGRIDYPAEFEVIAEWQSASLKSQGAEPKMGRRLVGLLHTAGLKDIESGVLGAHWQGQPSASDRELEWKILRHDLNQNSGAGSAPEEIEEKIRSLMEREESAWKKGERILFVPTFFAWGRVP